MVDKWEEVTRKLIADTKSGKVKWKVDRNATVSMVGDAEVGLVFGADVRDKRVVVYTYKVYVWDEEGNPVPVGANEVNVEFVDRNTGQSEWTWPSSKGRHELLEAIQYQNSNADKFLDDFLSQ